MRKFITILNLVLAAAATCLTALVLVSAHTIQVVLTIAVCIVWTLCAASLLRSRRLWPWVGSLLAVSGMTLQVGADTLRLLALIWRAESGDRSIELDPSTIGIPLFFSGLFTVGALFMLAALLSLPAWRFKEQMPNI
jgi:hypothetical protein